MTEKKTMEIIKRISRLDKTFFKQRGLEQKAFLKKRGDLIKRIK